MSRAETLIQVQWSHPLGHPFLETSGSVVMNRQLADSPAESVCPLDHMRRAESSELPGASMTRMVQQLASPSAYTPLL